MVFGKRAQGYAPWRLVAALVLAMFALGPVAPVNRCAIGSSQRSPITRIEVAT